MRQSFADKYPGETLKALSWKQPFASLMLHGKVETRVWDSKYLGWVLICASKKPYSVKETFEICGEDQYKRAWNTIGADFIDEFSILLNASKMPCGQAIAIGKLKSSRHMSNFVHSFEGADIERSKKSVEDSCFVKYNPELWMHTYTDVQPIQPFDWHGTQGWSTVIEELKSKIILL